MPRPPPVTRAIRSGSFTARSIDAAPNAGQRALATMTAGPRSANPKETGPRTGLVDARVRAPRDARSVAGRDATLARHVPGSPSIRGRQRSPRVAKVVGGA